MSDSQCKVITSIPREEYDDLTRALTDKSWSMRALVRGLMIYAARNPELIDRLEKPDARVGRPRKSITQDA